MKRCMATILLMLSLEALALAGHSAAVADDVGTIIRLPTDGKADLAREVMAAERKKGDVVGEAEERPWKCCDVTVCTRSFPPTCRCLDNVKHCAGACKRCEASKSDPSRRVCHDRYRGDPGPRCTHDGTGGALGDHHVAAATKLQPGKKKERPWKCCDDAICGMSFPPICFCRDKVDRCAAACKNCEKDEEDSSRYICKDPYRGDAGPRCTEDGNGNGDGIRAGVADDRQVMAAAAAMAGKKKKGAGEDERPWNCCDLTLCTRSFPPICFCRDKVDRCAAACQSCEQVESHPSRYECMESYQGWPGPRCTQDVAVAGGGGN